MLFTYVHNIVNIDVDIDIAIFCQKNRILTSDNNDGGSVSDSVLP